MWYKLILIIYVRTEKIDSHRLIHIKRVLPTKADQLSHVCVRVLTDRGNCKSFNKTTANWNCSDRFWSLLNAIIICSIKIEIFIGKCILRELSNVIQSLLRLETKSSSYKVRLLNFAKRRTLRELIVITGTDDKFCYCGILSLWFLYLCYPLTVLRFVAVFVTNKFI